MVSQKDWQVVVMEIAHDISKLSNAQRKKVGCVIVKEGAIISNGFNGTPAGWFTNLCEDENGITKPEVLHAESNAIAKTAKSTLSCEGADLFVTLSPCFECAKLIIQAGISKVFYSELYHNTDGLTLLEKADIPTKQIERIE